MDSLMEERIDIDDAIKSAKDRAKWYKQLLEFIGKSDSRDGLTNFQAWIFMGGPVHSWTPEVDREELRDVLMLCQIETVKVILSKWRFYTQQVMDLQELKQRMKAKDPNLYNAPKSHS